MNNESLKKIVLLLIRYCLGLIVGIGIMWLISRALLSGNNISFSLLMFILISILALIVLIIGINTIISGKFTFKPGFGTINIPKEQWFAATGEDYPELKGISALIMGLVIIAISIAIFIVSYLSYTVK